jgi:hypothetical protein
LQTIDSAEIRRKFIITDPLVESTFYGYKIAILTWSSDGETIPKTCAYSGSKRRWRGERRGRKRGRGSKAAIEEDYTKGEVSTLNPDSN